MGPPHLGWELRLSLTLALGRTEHREALRASLRGAELRYTGTIPSDGRRGREARMAKKRAGGQSAPEGWIGRDVVIGVGASGARVSGELREVSDRGVVLHYGADHGRDPGHVFYPWSNVQAIQLPDDEAAADEEQPG